MFKSIDRDIKPGDYVRVPKGLTVYALDYHPTLRGAKTTTREMVVSVTKVVTYSSAYSWISYLDYDDARTANAMKDAPGNAQAQQKLADLKAKVAHMIDAEWVEWSTSRALYQDVIRLSEEEQAAKKAEDEKKLKTRKASLRQLMIPKTSWRLTKDVDIMLTPPFARDNPPAQRLVTLKAGAVLTVFDKTFDSMQDGIFVPVTVAFDGVENLDPEVAKSSWRMAVQLKNGVYALGVPIKALDGSVEQEGEAADQFTYVIKDRASGHYYKTTVYGYLQYHYFPEYTEWCRDREKANPVPDRNSPSVKANWQASWEQHRREIAAWEKKNPPPPQGENRIVPGMQPFEMVTKVSQAKKHTDIGKVKMTILNFSGYYDGMSDQQAGMAEWSRGDYRENSGDRYDLPATFEAVKINKLTKEEVEVIDLQDWYQKTWALRGLTQKFGSSVRGVYKKLEKAGKLDQFEYVVTFRPEFDADYQEAPEAKAIKEIEEFVKEQLDKPVKEKDAFGVSVAVASLGEAMALRLAYDGEAHVIDFGQMAEVVEEVKQVA